MLLTTLRPTSCVCTSPASRRTERCFMTPKRLSAGNRPTMSVVVLGPRRSKSRIARRVGSASALQTRSRLSSILAVARGARARRCFVVSTLDVTLQRVQHLTPTLGHPGPKVRRNGAEHLILEDEFGALVDGREPDDQVTRYRMRHHERSENLEQRRRLDRLDESPEMPAFRAQIAEPAPAGFALELQREPRLSRLSSQVTQMLEQTLEDLLRRGLDLQGLLDIHHQLVLHRLIHGNAPRDARAALRPSGRRLARAYVTK